MKYEDIPKMDLQPMIDKMMGIVLTRFRGFTVDCNDEPINEDAFYKIEKHLPSGKVIVLPTGEDAKKEFVGAVMNTMMRKSGKLN